MTKKHRFALTAIIALAVAAPLAAQAQERPAYCQPGWARAESGLSDEQRQICSHLPPPPDTRPGQCEGPPEACKALGERRRAEATETAAEARIARQASPRLRAYFGKTKEITLLLVKAYRASACGLRSEHWYDDLVNEVWLLGAQERRRLGLAPAEIESANDLTNLLFKRLGQPRCGEFTVETLRQLDAFASEMKGAYR